MKGPQSKESACWYDNELGYTHTLLKHVAAVARFFNVKAEA